MAATLVPSSSLHLLDPEQEKSQALEARSSIALSCKIHADTRRISQALTEPEYMEAWMCFPAADQCRVVAKHQKDRFQIECFSAGRLEACVAGVFLIRQERELLFSWERNLGGSQSRSFVNIRLQCNSRTSLLELRHIGLVSADDFAWHEQLWNASLSKLAFLLSPAYVS